MGNQFYKTRLRLDLSDIFYQTTIDHAIVKCRDKHKLLEIDHNKIIVDDQERYVLAIDLEEFSEILIKPGQHQTMIFKHINLFDLTAKHKLKRT